MTHHEIGKLFKTLGLEDAFKDLEYGGVIDELLLMLRIPMSKKNTKMLKEMFPNRFNKVAVPELFDDEGISKEDDDIAEYTFTTTIVDNGIDTRTTTTENLDGTVTVTVTGSTEEAGTTYEYRYGFYRISKRELDRFNGEQLSEILTVAMSFYTGTEKPCPYDNMIVFVAVVIVVIATAGSGTGPMAAWATAATAVSGTITIGLQLGVWKSKKTRRNLTIVAAVLGLAGAGMAAYASVSTSAGVASQTAVHITTNEAIALSLQTVNAINSVYSTIETYSFNEDMTLIDSQIADYDRMLEEEWEQNMRFVFGDSFDSHVVDGIETDPYDSIRDVYKNYSVY